MNEKNIVDKFFELIDELYRNDVEYILIGGFAVILYGLPRTTGDIDLVIKKDVDNIRKLRETLKKLYAEDEIDEITAEELIKYPVIRFGTDFGFYIDLIVSLGKSFYFENIDWTIKEVEGHRIKIATAESLIKMKKDTRREIDNADILFLQEIIKK
jgi:hypothetical protein